MGANQHEKENTMKWIEYFCFQAERVMNGFLWLKKQRLFYEVKRKRPFHLSSLFIINKRGLLLVKL